MHGNGRNAARATATGTGGQGPQRYFAQHDFEGTAKLTTTLVHAISNVTGADVSETEFTLNDHVDPQALDLLFRPKADGTPRSNGQVEFTMWGHRVTVYSDGQITIVPPQNQPQPAQG